MGIWRRRLLLLVALLCACAGVVTFAQLTTTQFYQPAVGSATWTVSTAVNTRLEITTTRLTFVLITADAQTGFTNAQLSFEGYDGAAYFPVSAVREDNGQPEQLVSLVARDTAWQIDATGWQRISVRLNQPVEGGSLSLRLIATAAPGVLSLQAPQNSANTPVAGARPSQQPPPRFQLVGTFGRTVGSQNDALKAFVVNSIDPCQTPLKGNTAISQVANARLLSGGANRRVYLCSFFVVGADSENLSLVEGSGTTCGTGTTAIVGGTTAANGANMAANSGFALGNGQGTIAVSLTPGNDLCLFQSGSGRVAGNLTYVSQ
jgi:hypothetical protein